MVTLEPYNKLDIKTLVSVFNETTNSYKFYWFLAILDELSEKRIREIKIEDLVQRIFDQVWYPIDFYLLSFGKQDGFKKIADLINNNLEIDNKINSKPLSIQVKEMSDAVFFNHYNRKLQQLTRWVPFRFIRPFLKKETSGLPDQFVNKKIVELANEKSKLVPEACPYYLLGNSIIINNIWYNYFIENIGLLKSFIFWNLIRFLQKNNPNVPAIAEKLFKPKERDLRISKMAWKRYLQANQNNKCIYSKLELSNNIEIDHFIPWTFVAHDLNWNLTPTISNINAIKSNKLPSLNRYLQTFCKLQYSFFQNEVLLKPNSKLLEDYSNLFKKNIREIKDYTEDIFVKKIQETIIPLEQIATNQGFINDWIYCQ